MELYELTVHELKEKLNNKKITSSDIVKSYAKRIDEKDFSFTDFEIKPYETCSKCSFKTICRTTYDVSGEKAND